MTADFTRLFVDVDDCWKAFEKMYAKHLEQIKFLYS